MKYLVNSAIILIICISQCSHAETIENDLDLEKWFYSDEEISTDHVNEGILRLLKELPVKPVLHSNNHITINEKSLTSGWVLLEQCYENLDPVAITEIVYQYAFMRHLRISDQFNIESSKINNNAVRLENVKKNAKLCIKADVKILNKQNDGTFSLINGPFHRKFLDGYYPYHVSLRINYPSSIIKLISITPKPQQGFEINKTADSLLIESYFEGKLTVVLLFKPNNLFTSPRH